MKVTAIVPIKEISTRLPNKNFKLFSGKPLYTYIIDTLEKTKEVSEILVNTDCPNKIEHITPKMKIIQRSDENLGQDVEMWRIILETIPYATNEVIIKAQSTNPLISVNTIQGMINAYILFKWDSLFSVTEFKKRFYDSEINPINHSIDYMEKTQLVKPLYMENNCLWIYNKSTITKYRSEFGIKNQYYPISLLESIDIDTEDEFITAEAIYDKLS
jgi:N-acylneuraminate cytidylyltransferase